jgi:hypothetical protein
MSSIRDPARLMSGPEPWTLPLANTAPFSIERMFAVVAEGADGGIDLVVGGEQLLVLAELLVEPPRQALRVHELGQRPSVLHAVAAQPEGGEHGRAGVGVV